MGERHFVTGAVFSLNAPWQDWIFIPVVSVWMFINFELYPAYPKFIFEIGTFQAGANVVFPYTWASSLLLFIYGLWLFHRRYGLDYIRTVIYAVSLSFAATSLFEIIYQNIGSGIGGGKEGLEGQLINLSAIALALSSLRFWKASKMLLSSLVLFLTGWIVWVSVGYPQIYNANPVLAMQAYAFNVALKVGAFGVVGLLVSFGASPRGPQEDRETGDCDSVEVGPRAASTSRPPVRSARSTSDGADVDSIAVQA